MALMQALALLAGAANGYARKQSDVRDQARQDEVDAHNRWVRQRAVTKAEREDKLFADQQADREAERAAMAPTKVDDTPVAPPIGSRDEPRAPEDQGFRAAGQSFTNRADADAAATAYNALPARVQRAASSVSDPARAAQLETIALNAESGVMARTAARRKEIEDAYNRDLMASVTDFPSLVEFVNNTKGDGRGGGLKIQTQPSADGKTVQVLRLNPDGTTAPTPFTFQNSTEGVQQAVGIIGMKLSPTDKLAHLQATAKTEEDRRRWNAEYNLKRTDSENRGKREDRMARAAERLAAAAESTAAVALAKAKAGTGGLTLADLKDGHKAIATTLNADYKTQIENAADDKTSKAIKTTREAEIADVQRIYTGAMQAGFALTPEQAIVAYRTGQKRSGTYKTAEGNGTVKVDGVVYQGKFIPMADVPGAALPAAQAPEPSAAVTPASAPAAKPGLMARLAMKEAPAPESGEAAILDSARSAETAARQRLLTFGSRQRATDPQGFAAAERDHQAALQALQQAEVQWRNSVQGQAGSAFRYAQP